MHISLYYIIILHDLYVPGMANAERSKKSQEPAYISFFVAVSAIHALLLNSSQCMVLILVQSP